MRRVLAIPLSFISLFISHFSLTFIENGGIMNKKAFDLLTACFLCNENILLFSLIIIPFLIFTRNKEKIKSRDILALQLALFYLMEVIQNYIYHAHTLPSLTILFQSLIVQLPISIIISIILSRVINKIINYITTKKIIKVYKEVIKILIRADEFIEYLQPYLTKFLRSPPRLII